ncbi:MAG: SDR family NAD(P)-dependent oxidoreductase [Proteobacteria bacterium]|nr:SDR family NAD(P)-dependent oxidoreductase [Pseudomonadota bacterium]
MRPPIFITGVAGFIGFHFAKHLLATGKSVVGVDDINPYYDPKLKEARLKALASPHFTFHKLDIADYDGLFAVMKKCQAEYIVHLAAQAGVRHSIDNPRAYHHSNLTGFFNVLEACRHLSIAHLLYASSSSVYGASTDYPYGESQPVNHPISFYAASKKANEAMAHAYAHIYSVPCTALRFFTVYGPWGRPDMALWRFTERILADDPIPIFGEGKMQRDFTYCDDVSLGMARLLDLPPTPNPAWDSTAQPQATSAAPWRIVNIGNNKPTELEYFIAVLEEALGKKAKRDYQPMQLGDVVATAADITAIQSLIDFTPQTSIEEGIPKFVNWYRQYKN